MRRAAWSLVDGSFARRAGVVAHADGARAGGGFAAGVRRDALPEGTEYRDTGCSVSASCLACPLAECRYVVPPNVQRRAAESVRARELRSAGLRPVEIARALGRSKRSVFRYLEAV